MKYAFTCMEMASVTAFLGLTLLGIGVVRSKVLPAWTIVPLIIARLAAIPRRHHTLHGMLIGLGWLMVGYALWKTGPGTVNGCPRTSDRLRTEPLSSGLAADFGL